MALALPEAVEGSENFAFSVPVKGKHKGFVWVWQERVHPKKARVPTPAVLAVRVANLDEKDMLLSIGKGKFFTEPHYNGFPAILIRLEAVEPWELEELIANAWRCMAPKALLAQYEASKAEPTP